MKTLLHWQPVGNYVAVASGNRVIQIFDRYQKERVLFVQSVADLATRPQNVEALMNAGVMALLRPLLLDNVPSIQQSAALACCALGCCVLFGLVLGAILNTGPMMFLRTLLADVVAPTTPAAPPRPLPAILKRLRTMQRATAPGDHGVSTESMLAAFPTWSRNGSVQVEEALKDVSLALVMLSNHLPSVAVLFEHVEL